MKIKDPKFNLLEEVYHITPESPKGYVIDIRYGFATCSFEYLVAFGIGPSNIYFEHELTKTKTF